MATILPISKGMEKAGRTWLKDLRWKWLAKSSLMSEMAMFQQLAVSQVNDQSRFDQGLPQDSLHGAL